MTGKCTAHATSRRNHRRGEHPLRVGSTHSRDWKTDVPVLRARWCQQTNQHRPFAPAPSNVRYGRSAVSDRPHRATAPRCFPSLNHGSAEGRHRIDFRLGLLDEGIGRFDQTGPLGRRPRDTNRQLFPARVFPADASPGYWNEDLQELINSSVPAESRRRKLSRPLRLT